jgi:hypothetical protein
MKKIFVTGTLALLSFGLYAGLINTTSAYVHEDYAAMGEQPYQDTSTHKNKKNKKDKKKKDTVSLALSPAVSLTTVK